MDWVLLASVFFAAVAALASLTAVRDARLFHQEERAAGEIDRLLLVHGIVAEIQERAARRIHETVNPQHVADAISKRQLRAALAACPISLTACEALADLDTRRDEDRLVASEEALTELQSEIRMRSSSRESG